MRFIKAFIKAFIKLIKDNKNFIFLSFFLAIIIIILAFYISNLAFAGKNSYSVYTNLKYKKQQLELNIRKIQLENAKLQKQYLELKNLEPEEL